jgi:uncharacterized membrane protein
MSVITSVAAIAHSERGQMLMTFALLVVPVTFVLGAVAVDASMWQSERRGAQKDADLASLAGAYELLDQAAGETMTIDAAQAAVNTNQDINDQVRNAENIGTIGAYNGYGQRTIALWE